MISKKAVEYLENRFHVNEFDMDFDLVFGDLTDEDLKAGLRKQPEDYWSLVYILAEMATDEEVESHILGFTSLAHRKAEIAKTEALIERINNEFS